MSQVIVSVSEGVATLTLNNPAERNILTDEMVADILTAMDEIEGNPAVDRDRRLQEAPGTIGLPAAGRIAEDEENFLVADRHRQQPDVFPTHNENCLMPDLDHFQVTRNIRHFHLARR
mgnify:CR=1 FL=1